ncbi:MAG: tRNA uridine-5-carboxymethylaminomethyl(34) synthesis GTPase MnmE [Candidatus Omnitrophica bacterium]|nr:tRNA uridine-5-carboxymethylaminomethyl(34) synthesis GTPase MnmE [Candidatus Omnitrophota bacterium]
MKKNNLPLHAQDDTIAAVSTPIGEGGISIVRLSGAESLAIAERIFVSSEGRKLSGFATHTVHYGKIKDPKAAEIIDEVLVTVMRAPRSYTREDVIEINCHGGIQSAKRTLGLVLKSGARAAEPGEFTKRAFLNGRIDLAQAEAIIDVIRAKTEGSLKVAMNQLEGELSRRINEIRDKILDIASEVEASVDFPEESPDIPEEADKALSGIDGVVADIERLISTYEGGSVMREGVLAILCGKPNVGKSSLMNLLLKRDRVIVSAIPGTTRDAVEEMINLGGIPVRLVDTAGISDTKDALEREGIARSRTYLAMADIAIVVLDHSSGIDGKDMAIIEMVKDKKKVVVVNKSDLPGRIKIKDAERLSKGGKVVEISVKKRENIEALEKEMADVIWSGRFAQGESAVMSNARHKELLDKALANMLSVKKALRAGEPPEILAIDLKDAASSLGLITGKTISDDILDRIFGRFCIGK